MDTNGETECVICSILCLYSLKEYMGIMDILRRSAFTPKAFFFLIDFFFFPLFFARVEVFFIITFYFIFRAVNGVAFGC